MSQSEICPKCKQPIETSKSGSLTDWINKCRCGLVAEEEELFLSLKFCQNCQKRISDSRHGSLTQWIFRSDLCSCEKPYPVKPSPSEDHEIAQSSWQTIELQELDDVDVDFPIEDFKPVEEIGSGNAGVVFRSQDRRLQNIVAIKILQNFDPEQIVSFQKEAKITALLEHENIIQIRDIGVANESTPYMVLEYVAGLSLSEYIAQTGPLDWITAIGMTKQISSAIQYAHAQNIFHRDITPRNMLVTKDEQGDLLVKVIDFGVAAFQQRQEDRVEYQGQTLAGTPGYLCPDQAAGLEFDASCDIYSIGCILYESLVGEPLFTGDSAIDVLSNQVSTNINILVDSLTVPESVKTVLLGCLAKDREERYKSASELSDDLDLCLQEDDEAQGEEKLETNEGSHFTKVLAGSFLAISIGLLGTFSWMLYSDYAPSEKKELEEPIGGVVLGKQLGLIEETAPGVFRGHVLTDDDTLNLIKDRDDIHTLSLANSVISGDGLRYLSNLPISELNLESTAIPNESIAALFKINSLQSINLQNTKTTGVNFDGFKNLKYLNMKYSRLNDAGAECISRIKRLEWLSFSGGNLSKQGIVSLSKAKKLKRLEIDGNSLSSSDLEPIKKMQSLETLVFRDRSLSKEDILLAQSKSVKNLHCWNTKFEHKNLYKEFSQLKNLKFLSLGIPTISRANVKEIQESLPDCQVEDSSASISSMVEKQKKRSTNKKSFIIEVVPKK